MYINVYPMDYLQKLGQCLAIAKAHNNREMERNVLKAKQEYLKRLKE